MSADELVPEMGVTDGEVDKPVEDVPADIPVEAAKPVVITKAERMEQRRAFRRPVGEVFHDNADTLPAHIEQYGSGVR